MNDKFSSCPNCHSGQCVVDDYSEEENFFFVKKECEWCGFTWFEVYEYLRSEDEMGNVYGMEITP